VYIPNYFRNDNRAELLAFVNAHPLAVICSNAQEVPLATHLPFTIREENDKLFLVSHFAKANPHAAALKENDRALVIFSGPNAYISPVHYEKKENVPTWNYIAVHATGIIHFLDSDAQKEKVLLDTILNFDPDYKAQWDELSQDYISGMMKGIVAFEIEVTNLEGKFKLSQNKTKAEQERIASAPGTSELSSYMKKNNSSGL
jgi:transcriptional regulator